MNTVHRILLALAVLVAASAPAFAWGWEVRVSTPLTNRLASELEVGETGDDLYEAQEGAHAAITSTTGVEVPHDYVYVCLGDECVPVDPIHFSN